MSRWFQIDFPEYKTVYGKPDAKSGMLILKAAPLPEDILTLGGDGVNQIWRDTKIRAVGKAREKTLIEATEHSVGSKEGAASVRMEIRMLLEDYEYRNVRLQEEAKISALRGCDVACSEESRVRGTACLLHNQKVKSVKEYAVTEASKM